MMRGVTGESTARGRGAHARLAALPLGLILLLACSSDGDGSAIEEVRTTVDPSCDVSPQPSFKPVFLGSVPGYALHQTDLTTSAYGDKLTIEYQPKPGSADALTPYVTVYERNDAPESDPPGDAAVIANTRVIVSTFEGAAGGKQTSASVGADWSQQDVWVAATFTWVDEAGDSVLLTPEMTELARQFIEATIDQKRIECPSVEGS